MQPSLLRPFVPALLVAWLVPAALPAATPAALAELELKPAQVHPGGTVQATYIFQTGSGVPEDCSVFVHVVRPDGGHIGADFTPRRPTRQWPADAFVHEGPFPIVLPADAQPGDYQVWVGLVSSESEHRLPMGNTDRLRGSLEYHVGDIQVLAGGTPLATESAVFQWHPVAAETLLTNAPALAPGTKALDRLQLAIEPKVLNPIRQKNAHAKLTLTAHFADGTQKTIRASQAGFRARTKTASGNVPVVRLEGDEVIPLEGGVATVEADYVQNGQRFRTSADVVVTPYYREYRQTLVMKLFLGMEGKPVERLANEPLFQKPHDVLCTFPEALDVIRRADNLTRGIPKIIYLVGWQKGGHDHGYPAWSEVNPRLKRPEDATALDSLRWLIREGRKFNTTVSLHINMVDAYRQSPLWDEYVAKDCFARDAEGKLFSGGIQMQGEEMYNVVYPREWAEGLAQRRIDGLIQMIPELKEGHTIHVDVFIAQREGRPLSEWHAKPENGGLTPDKYVETQRKIFHYWRERGFDVTGEGTGWAHPPGEHFVGLQPMSWWYSWDPMQIPECLGARGRTDRGGDGDFRFGSSMHGEEIWQKDIHTMPGFLGMFCRTTLPWYYLSRLERLRFENETLYYSDGVVARVEDGHRMIRKDTFVLRDNDDLFVPALWVSHGEIIAYSRSGYAHRVWQLPGDWQKVRKVDTYRITLEGSVPLQKGLVVNGGKVTLSLQGDEAVAVVPAGTKVQSKQ